MKPYHLSYQVGTVNWDGKYVQKLEPEEYLPTVKAIRAAGVREVMISGYVTLEEAAFDMDEETKRLGALLDSLGMRPAQHHGLAALYAPIGNPQEPVVERLIREIHYTANMNAPALVIHPCHYYEPESWSRHVTPIEMFEREAARHGEDAILAVEAQNLHTVGAEAEKCGVKIALENLDRFEPVANVRQLPQLVKAADSPAVGFCLDSGHANCCGVTSVTDWISVMGDKLFTTHFHDNRGARFPEKMNKKWVDPSHELDEHMPPGFGTIPWINVVQALWKIGYDRTVNFESGAWPIENGFEHAVAYWRSVEKLAETR